MNEQPGSAAYSEYIRLVLELHTTITNDTGESEREDAIRDAMDEPWYALTDEEKVTIRQLSEDLDTLGDRYVAVESDPSRLQQLEQARDARDWMAVLKLLQEQTMQHVAPAIRARLRGDAWFALGVPAAACLFYQDALAAMSSWKSPESPPDEAVDHPPREPRKRFPRYRISEAA